MPGWMTTSSARCGPVLELAVANLDFEYELAGRGALPDGLAQRWQFILRLLAREAECLDPTTLTVRTESATRLWAWGVTPRIARLAASLGLSQDFPSLEVVREVNDKRFSHQLEQKLGIALPHSQVVDSLEQFRSAVEACPFSWVLKHPLGVSARERVVGKPGHISDSAWGWARRKLHQSWTLLFEPWVEQRHDFSLHFEIDRHGQHRFVGHCELVSDPGGVYRGNRVLPSSILEPAALECGHKVAAELSLRGYWGPVGIDAFSGVLGDKRYLRPLVEINARCSFGRLALALSDWIPQGWCHLWWHPQVNEASLTPLPARDLIQPGAYALPLAVDPTQGSRTILMVAPTAQELQGLGRDQAGAPAASIMRSGGQ